MKLAVFTMFRNEAAILDPFLDQLDSLFDTRILVDHESTDLGCDLVRKRAGKGTHLFHLKAAGYPQSQLATLFTRWTFENTDADWLFFLDCDEFLPFASRAALHDAMDLVDNFDATFLHWRNLCPKQLNGEDIFKAGFECSTVPSKYQKFIISRRLFEKDPALQIAQGYHAIASEKTTVEAEILSPKGLYHIPLQSKLRFAAKLRNSGERLIAEQSLLSNGLGFHWLSLYRQLQQQGLERFDFQSVALNYPDATPAGPDVEECDFSFDYVKTPFSESVESLFTQMIEAPAAQSNGSGFFILYDDKGEVIQGTPMQTAVSVGTSVSFPENGETNDLFAPLFSLPVSLPLTAWAGHIPFLFVLMKLLRPKSYVDLGVHYGASLLAAATAATTYKLPTQLYGIDNWAGDEHAGFYEGDYIYNWLSGTVDQHFRNVRLIRSYFDDAADQFLPGSIDLLHIDGLHTYEAVRHDFETWLPKVSPSGVILFHDTRVFERGFEVYRFWRELEARFTTLEFTHSYGLGVAFLDSGNPAIAPLVEIARKPNLLASYRVLAEGIGSSLQVRMRALEPEPTTAPALAPSSVSVNVAEIEALRAQIAAYEAEVEAFRLERDAEARRSLRSNWWQAKASTR